MSSSWAGGACEGSGVQWLILRKGASSIPQQRQSLYIPRQAVHSVGGRQYGRSAWRGIYKDCRCCGIEEAPFLKINHCTPDPSQAPPAQDDDILPCGPLRRLLCTAML